MVVMNMTVQPIVQTHASKGEKYQSLLSYFNLMGTSLVLLLLCEVVYPFSVNRTQFAKNNIVHLSREEKREKYACYQFIQCATYDLSESLHGNSRLHVDQTCVIKI